MNSTKFFPSTIPQVLLFLLISFIWIFLVVQFDLKYMNHFTLDKRMSIESLLMFIGAVLIYYLINYIKKRNAKITLRTINSLLLIKTSIIAIAFVILVYSINTIISKGNNNFNPYNSIWMVISIGIIGPIGEELIFRGIIQRGLNQTLKARWSIVISALLFMLVHQPSQYPLAILTGILFGYVYYKTNNILLPIILHIITNNFSTFLAFILFKYNFIQENLFYICIPGMLILLIMGFKFCKNSNHFN